jgi:zinc-binding alcohol dehydrogenase family protein
MKAVTQTAYGGVEVFQIAEIPKPTARPHDLIVRVKAVATNPIDTKKRVGFGLGLPLSVGWHVPGHNSSKKEIFHLVDKLVLGWDAAGVVESVGSEVKHYKVGDEVYFAGSISRQGCFAEFVAVDERIVGRKPKNLSFEDAAAIPLTGLTAWEALVDKIGIPVPTTPEQVAANSKKTLLIWNGAGGVGSIATQIARHILKVNVISTASREESIAHVKKMGAHHVINHRNDVVSELAKIGVEEVDYIFNTNDFTPELLASFFKVIKPFGHINAIVPIFVPVDLGLGIIKSVSFSYELMFTRSLLESEDIIRQKEILDSLATALEAGTIVSHAHTRFDSLTKLGEAHRLQESGTSIGKIVISANF